MAAQLSGVGQETAVPGMQLLRLLFRLLQVVRIHQPNNQLFQENLEAFRQTLRALWSEVSLIDLRYTGGRFFLNDERLNYSSAMLVTAGKMID